MLAFSPFICQSGIGTDGWSDAQVNTALSRLLSIQNNTLAGAGQTALVQQEMVALNEQVASLHDHFVTLYGVVFFMLVWMLLWIGFQIGGFFVPSPREQA